MCFYISLDFFFSLSSHQHRAEAVSGYYDDTSDYSIKGETNAVAVVVAPVVEQNLSFAMSTLLM
jgi:hypothetical protein